MDRATAENSRLVTFTSRHFRMLHLEFDDGRVVSAWFPKTNWRPIVAAALCDAPVGLKRLLAKSLRGKRQAEMRLPVCNETVSLVYLLNIVEGLGLPTALRVAAAWTRLPAHDRTIGSFWLQTRSVVQAQLLGLIDPPSPLIRAVTPMQFQTFLKAARCVGLSSVLDLDWRMAHTPLGCTTMVFARRTKHQRTACLAISTCEVSYLPMGGNKRLEGHRAVQVLLDQLPAVVAHEDACPSAGWRPAGHEIMEIADFLERLKSHLGQ